MYILSFFITELAEIKAATLFRIVLFVVYKSTLLYAKRIQLNNEKATKSV